MSGIIANNDWRISLLAGGVYLFEPEPQSRRPERSRRTGTDFLKNLYRLRFAQFFKV